VPLRRLEPLFPRRRERATLGDTEAGLAPLLAIRLVRFAEQAACAPVLWSPSRHAELPRSPLRRSRRVRAAGARSGQTCGNPRSRASMRRETGEREPDAALLRTARGPAPNDGGGRGPSRADLRRRRGHRGCAAAPVVRVGRRPSRSRQGAPRVGRCVFALLRVPSGRRRELPAHRPRLRRRDDRG
jgi:hypothetical protein